MTKKHMTRPKSFLLIASFLGGLYCVSNLFGAELFCGTRGCEIYAGYGLFGISFYLYGFGGFLGIFLLTLFSRYRFARPLLALTLGLALLIDTLFLIYQTLLWPCSSCQVVALMIGISAFAGAKTFNLPGRKLLIGVGIVWSIFFIYVSVAVVKEVAFRPWPIYGSTEAPVKIYFSPTCPSCEEVVRKVFGDEQTAAWTGLYPIVKNEEDEVRLARVLEAVADKVDANAVLELFAPASQKGPALKIGSRVRLLSNKMALARSDVTKVPLILSPYIVETGGSANGLSLPIETLWGDSLGNSSDTGCSTIAAEADCE